MINTKRGQQHGTRVCGLQSRNQRAVVYTVYYIRPQHTDCNNDTGYRLSMHETNRAKQSTANFPKGLTVSILTATIAHSPASPHPPHPLDFTIATNPSHLLPHIRSA